jgi:DNA-binding SARP family transcriptional activator
MPVRADLRIIRRGEAYELAMASGAYFDVDVFRVSISTAWDAARTGDHAAVLIAANAAIEVYRGDLLVDEGPADWVITPRENLRLDLVRAATLAAESALQLGDPRAAIRAIERGIAVDRYASRLWELLITAHEEAGDRVAAVRVRHSFDEAMADLGV